MSKEAFFFLNFVNVFEENNRLIVDILGYDSPDILNQLFLEKLRSGKFDVKDESKFMRFVIPLEENYSNVRRIENLKCFFDKFFFQNIFQAEYGSATAVEEGGTVWLSPQLPLAEKGYKIYLMPIFGHPVVQFQDVNIRLSTRNSRGRNMILPTSSDG